MAKTKIVYREDEYTRYSELYISNGDLGVVTSISPELDKIGLEGLVSEETGKLVGYYILGFHKWNKSKIENLRQFKELDELRFTWEEENILGGSLITILKVALYEFVLDREERLKAQKSFV